jgi:hypothetical protein
MRANKLRELLKSNKPTLSTHIHTTWPSVVEAVASGSCGVPRPSLADYVIGTGATRGATAAGERAIAVAIGAPRGRRR